MADWHFDVKNSISKYKHIQKALLLEIELKADQISWNMWGEDRGTTMDLLLSFQLSELYFT